MRWGAQVGHVMAKDVRQARWMVLGYLAIVAIATASAFQWPGASNPSDSVAMFLVVVTGIFVAGFFVQADSPTRSDAFWAPRPLHPGAVLTAKALLVLLLLVGPALLAQALVLVFNDLSAATVLGLLVRSIWIYALWLLIAMVLGAVTPDIRSFIVGLVMMAVAISLILIASSVVQSGRSGPSSRVLDTVVPIGLIVVGIGTSLWLLVSLYRTRRLRRRTWLAATVAVVCTFFALVAERPARASRVEQLARLEGDFGMFVEVVQGNSASPSLNVGISRAQASDRLAVADMGTVVLALRGGSTIRVPLGGRFKLMTPTLPVGKSVRWLTTDRAEPEGLRTGVVLTREQREAMRAGVVSASIEGTASVWEPRLRFMLPFRAGASARRDGKAVRIMTVNPRNDDSLAVVATSSVGRETFRDEMFMTPWDPPRYALVNEGRGEAFVVRGGFGGASGALVLPGAWRFGGKTPLQLRGDVRATTDWLRRANLVVFDWVPRGRASLHVDATVRTVAERSYDDLAAPLPSYLIAR